MTASRPLPFLVFQHIPKTAGTSLQVFLRELWPAGTIWPPAEEIAGVTHRARQRPWREPGFWEGRRVIAGHFPQDHDVIHALGERPAVFAAVLREPLARAVSYYDFVRRTQSHHFHRALSGLTLCEALETFPNFATQVRCRQLDYLFGSADLYLVQHTLAQHSFLLGRTDALPAFRDFMVRFAGRGEDAPPLRRLNAAADAEPLFPPAATQPDYRKALQILREWNSAESAFLRRIDPLLASRGLREAYPDLVP